ncbi:DNA-formamidopyrimidine glycosylase family protein [Pedobacter mucosus]|uniref:DNA-formamidopyrimidine glycosylase family protein n=1 Tax=Pedobacter mucosus TaxID=2895286 RepID=UPI001EE42646|nr:DNA-formamidopyrimidine glycosylase family protein [Pedobacter mucosus]UKT65330.1 endonuclease [Pedobacter mucosus]
MPEGPSIIILKDLIKDLDLHKPEIIEVAGNLEDKLKDRLLHQHIQSFKSWGKHFLICFKDFTLRIHFMLFGTYLINDRKKNTLKLGLTLPKDELNFYNCKIDILEGDIDDHYDWSVDIMADHWDEKAALEKLKQLPESFVCDVLLDQQIFAGSGNIIKNEVMYRVGVHPLTKIKDLPAKKLKDLVKEIRKYSFDFLKWKSVNKLSEHWEVYLQKTCPFGHKINKEKLGKTHRQTYYCSKCQKLYN